MVLSISNILYKFKDNLLIKKIDKVIKDEIWNVDVYRIRISDCIFLLFLYWIKVKKDNLIVIIFFLVLKKDFR